MKHSLKTLAVVLLGLSLVAAACRRADDKKVADKPDDGKPAAPASADTKITIGAPDFGESAILAEIYKQGLEARGYKPTLQKLGAFRDSEIKAFESGTINFAPAYAASLLEFLNGGLGEAGSDIEAILTKLEVRLFDRAKLKALDASDVARTNAFVVTKATADRRGLRTLSDLATHGKDLKLGGPAECETNAFCLPGLQKTYHLDLSKQFRALETGQVAGALDAGSIEVASVSSTDGRISANGYVRLDDDKRLLPADNVLPVVTVDLAGHEDIVAAVNAITAKLTTDDLIEMNKRYDIDREDAAVIARAFLDGVGLL